MNSVITNISLFPKEFVMSEFTCRRIRRDIIFVNKFLNKKSVSDSNPTLDLSETQTTRGHNSKLFNKPVIQIQANSHFHSEWFLTGMT